MKLIVVECKGCGGYFPPKCEHVNSVADFFAARGWQFASDVYLSGATIMAFHDGIIFDTQDFRDVLSRFSGAIDLAYQNAPEDPSALALHLHFGDNVKVVAEISIAKPEETGSFLTAYLTQRR